MPAMISFRSVVDPSDCDFLGHMNVSRYFAACADGVIAIQSEMGLTANDMRSGRRLSFAVVNAQSDFRAELSAGDAIRLETSIVEIGSKSMNFRHRLIKAEGDAVAFETLFKCVMFSLEARRAVEIPQDVRGTAVQWLERLV
jgi:acyl-CoA thioester hydrolase